MAYDYLKPKAPQGNKLMKRKVGMFVNPPPYPQLGGFSDQSDLPPQDPPLQVEKQPDSRKGKPI